MRSLKGESYGVVSFSMVEGANFESTQNDLLNFLIFLELIIRGDQNIYFRIKIPSVLLALLCQYPPNLFRTNKTGGNNGRNAHSTNNQ